jgi:predicted RNA-binding Zn-ribbon protein involved in translation (DUF1610 family)
VRVFIAVVMSATMALIGIGMLRSLRSAPRSTPLPEIETPSPDVRVTFWCETCGTEVLLLRKGSESAPRHCGEAMIKREEITRN